MDCQKICENLKEIVDKLYRNEESGLDAVGEITEKLQLVIIELVSCFPNRINEIEQAVGELNQALILRDKLWSADCMNEICSMLADYVQHKKTNLQKAAYEKNTENYSIKEFYQYNIEHMKSAKMDIYETLTAYCEGVNIDDCSDVAIDEDGNIAVFNHGNWWRLNSFYNRKEAVNQALQPIKEKGYISQLYVLGMANMEYVNEILDTVPTDTIVLIYEPNAKVFEANLYYKDMSKIFERKYTFLFVEGVNEKDMDSYVDYYSNCIQVEYLYTFISPNYDEIYFDLLQKRVESCNRVMEMAIASENTVVMRGEEINYARIMNMGLLLHSTVLSELKDKFHKKINVEEFPAIIVAAGPSLDKNISLLHKAKGKAFIIAVDSAVRMLEKYDIEPDAFITLDAVKPAVLFQNKIALNTPLFYCAHSIYDYIKNLKGKKIYCNMDNVGDALLKHIGKEEQMISGGGSVSNAAFSIAQYIGFKNIIAIGLDLAFKDNKKHASVVYKEAEVNLSESSQYTYVQGINGEELLTYKNFVLYKEWYERRVQTGEVTLINATEGGAYIKGAVHMSFQNAIEKYCKKEVNVSEIISECKDIFDNNEVKEYKELLAQFEEDCTEIQKYYHKCLKLYEQILKTKDVNIIKDHMKEISRIDTFVSKFIVTRIISDYAAVETEKELKKMYEESNVPRSQWVEIRENVNKGIAVANAFIKGAEKAKKYFVLCREEIG